MNLTVLKHFPHRGSIEEAFGAWFYLMKNGLDLSGRCAVMEIIPGVVKCEQDTFRFENTVEFGIELQGGSPWELLQAEAGKDH